MTPIKQFLNRRIGLRETMAVIAVLLVLAFAGYGISKFVAAKILEARVRALFPQVCDQIRQQRQTVIAAIEAYRTRFGFYPPDHVLRRRPLLVDAVTNTLFYELAGVRYNPTYQLFEVRGMESAESSFVKQFLDCSGFTNCADNDALVQRFLPAGFLPASQVHDDPDVFALGTLPYDASDWELMMHFDTTSWRYVSTSPTNNPGKFDLWLEVKSKNQSITIGNWEAAR